MKILVSAMALAIALGWPAAGEAQSQKAKARSAPATHQHYVQRHTTVPRRTDIEREAVRRAHLGRMSGLGSRPERAHDDPDGRRPRRSMTSFPRVTITQCSAHA